MIASTPEGSCSSKGKLEEWRGKSLGWGGHKVSVGRSRWQGEKVDGKKERKGERMFLTNNIRRIEWFEVLI